MKINSVILKNKLHQNINFNFFLQNKLKFIGLNKIIKIYYHTLLTACLVLSHPCVLFANVQKGRKVLVFPLQDWPS